MKAIKFSINHPDEQMRTLVEQTDKRVLANWAIECAERVIHFFEDKFPDDRRPSVALETLQSWIDTGEFHMAIIRKASLGAHAAAREVGEDSPARSVARATGQAVATAHVKTHAYGVAIYAQQAVFRASMPSEAFDKANEERTWQFQRLMHLT